MQKVRGTKSNNALLNNAPSVVREFLLSSFSNFDKQVISERYRDSVFDINALAPLIHACLPFHMINPTHSEDLFASAYAQHCARLVSTAGKEQWRGSTRQAAQEEVNMKACVIKRGNMKDRM